MRHRKSGRQLNRNSSHRQAMFRNMASSLVKHGVIKTTVPKAKELRRVIEPLITLAKTDSVANRRLAFARTRDQEVVGILFNDTVLAIDWKFPAAELIISEKDKVQVPFNKADLFEQMLNVND